ncbi:UDP-N-acetyl-D-glucosamine dehydrogenase [Dongia mobilis]|uniref:UDP-N-acetyl-D-glucosamine dehydrogenase n=1 Tax=Dongia mobilis TaxID=578943 RepID=A0A4R6WLG0_9PROT|nr:nucleotide sugar dehydrogenase [Dongia mobilis]TDQ78827.1 UDP-N-acetyl-D-glucosamine dehydrogenase [Dongia mobilis]
MAIRGKSRKPAAAALLARIVSGRARIGIIGLGYVGLPLACVFAEKGFAVTGFDIDAAKTEKLAAGRSYIRHIPGRRIAPLVKAGRLAASSDFAGLKRMDAIIICVPTPLSRQREPDLSFVANTARTIARHLRKGQLVVLESSTYPGTTDDVVKPELEVGGLRSGRDFFLAYSPEREDPGNEQFGTAAIPKVVGGDGAAAGELAKALYDQVVVKTVPVTDAATAEAVKLTENIFRSVNIALVNELKVIFDAMGIDVWQVIEAAKTKPFGFMPFYPGPGLGGHCIPIDPFYLTWKAREFGISTRFIELAGEINTAMPRYVVARLTEALSTRAGKALKNARILIVGLAYKKNVDDMRESPALTLIDLLEAQGAKVDYHDPIITSVKPSREHPHLMGRRSVALSAATLGRTDAVLIVTDHDSIDYKALGRGAKLIIDTRDRMARAGWRGRNVVKA